MVGDLLPKLRLNGLRGRGLLDVGCGTGKSFLPMLERGWEVTGCDISPSMLELARAKAGNAVPLSVADMRELPLFGEFDLVWCSDDAVNYLLSREELEKALSGMRDNLAPGGLLMFDVNALQAYRTFFAEQQRVERGGRRLVWRGQASPERSPERSARRALKSSPGGRWRTWKSMSTGNATSPKLKCWGARAAGWSASTSTVTASTPCPSSRSTNWSTPRSFTSPAGLRRTASQPTRRRPPNSTPPYHISRRPTH